MEALLKCAQTIHPKDARKSTMEVTLKTHHLPAHSAGTGHPHYPHSISMAEDLHVVRSPFTIMFPAPNLGLRSPHDRLRQSISSPLYRPHHCESEEERPQPSLAQPPSPAHRIQPLCSLPLHRLPLRNFSLPTPTFLLGAEASDASEIMLSVWCSS